MSIDPLEFFHNLEQRHEEKKRKLTEDEKTYPGKTPPRNAGPVIDSEEQQWLNSLPAQEFSIGGEVRKFYTIGALAQALGKQPVTIRSWEQKGWLPPATFRTPAPRGPQIPGKAIKGRRLYSQEQLLFLTAAYKKYILDPRFPNWDGFRGYIKTNYPK
jgi:hypothetical protein